MTKVLSEASPSKSPPYSIEAEQSVLGAAMHTADAARLVLEHLRSDDFFLPRHRTIFRAIAELAAHEDPIDGVSVAKQLGTKLEEVGDKPYLFELFRAPPTVGSVRHYITIVLKDSRSREALEVSDNIRVAVHAGQLEEAALLGRNYFDGLHNCLTDDAQSRAGLAGCTAPELLAMEIPEPVWVIPGYLPEGLGLLVGKPKIGKSWLALGLAVAIAAGGKAFGHVPAPPAGVLYLALEDNQRRLKERLGTLLRGDPPPTGLRFEFDWPKLDLGGLGRLEAWLKQNPATKLIVVDTLQKVRQVSKAGGSAYAEDYEALGGLKRLADRYGIAVLVLHHERKLIATDILDAVSGTTGTTGAADTIFILRRERSRADAVLFMTGRDVEEAELAMRFDGDTATWAVVGDAEEYRRSQERQEVIDALAKASGPMTPSEVAAELGRSDASVKKLLPRMADNGEVLRLGYGKYTLPHHSCPSGHSVPPVTPVSLQGVTEGQELQGSTPQGKDSGPGSSGANSASKQPIQGSFTGDPTAESGGDQAGNARANVPNARASSTLGPGRARVASDTEKMIIQALDVAGEPLSPQAVALATGQKVETVRGLLPRMARAGLLVIEARGRYRLPDQR